jgi:hypothetical protein
MYEYMDLIRKEKEEALRDYREDAFRLRLDRKIAEEYQPSRSYASWFRKPAIAGSTVLLILFFGWLSTQIFLPSSRESDALILKNTFVQLFNQHASILDQSLQPIERGSDISAIDEFQWSLKRVIYAILKENAPDVDISESISRVLQSEVTFINPDK